MSRDAPEETANTTPPGRLAKLNLAAPLLRAIDIAVIQSRGAYRDRDEFVAEAVRDRLAEEGVKIEWHSALSASHQAPEGRNGEAEVPRREATRPPEEVLSSHDVSTIWTWTRWRGLGGCRMEREPGLGANWGLHNRDIGSLWALDLLAQMATEREGGVPWKDFVSVARERAQDVGAALRLLDERRDHGLKTAVGFPKAGPKQRASEERFIAGSVGALGAKIAGPLFILGLAGGSLDAQSVAPTEDGVALLTDLLEKGLSFDLPQPVPAAMRWWEHLKSCSAEFELWLRVLRVLEGSPSRSTLIDAFPEWSGSQADTNTMGVVSRLREWGLLEPQLRDGVYRLTDLGEELLGGVS